MFVQGAFNVLFRPGFRKDFRDMYQTFKPEYPSFLKEETTDQPEQSAVLIAGLSRLVERGDGEPVVYDTPNISNKVMGVDREFALGFMLTRRTVEDDQYGKANQASKWLAHAANMTKEYRSAALIDDAFAGNTFKGIDSNPLCSTSHSLIGSTATVANRPSTEVGLSITGITSLLDLQQSLKDENGDPMICNVDTLVISNIAGDYHKALQIFGSDKEPFTAENQDNAIKKRLSPKIVMSHYKSAATRSYFLVDSTLNDAHFVTRRAVTFDDDFDFNTDAALYKCSTRFLIWFVDWRGWFGCNPA